MKKSSKPARAMMTGCMFMNSNVSNSDDEKCRLSTADLISDDNDKEQTVIKRRQGKKTSSIRNSIENDRNRISFNESEYTDSGIGHETELYWQLSDDNDLSNQQSNALNDYEDGNTNDSHLSVEKTGWLNVKHWLTVEYYEKFQFTSKHQWNRFWIQLKDSTLLLFNNCSDLDPKLTINIIDCLCYPLSGHRPYVFSLTTNTGDTYCFQSSNQFEINHWIRCIHSHCLLKLNQTILKSNLKQLENDIIYENKMLKLAELQLKLSTNDRISLLISKQIELWEEKLEIYHIDLFRKKCYLSALNENENLPDLNDLLSQTSASTKTILCNLDAYTPCGFYACVISRRREDRQRSKLRQSPIQTDQFDSNSQTKVHVPLNKTTTVGELNQFSESTANMLNTNNEQPSSVECLSNTQQIQNVINELMETERSYIQDMQCLLKQYIKPLRNNSTVLPSDVIELLNQSVKSIHQLQNTFFENLQLNLLTENILISISETFINFSKHFKVYSTYCSIHLQITRLLNHYKTNDYLKQFLISCNPSHQHSLSFESYLIKPIQRILKYPLFLQQMFIYCNKNQVLSLKKAIKMMNKVTKYINSMQQLYEDFGESFEYFIKNSKQQHNPFERNLSDLYAYGEIDWINIYQFLSRKTSQSFKTFCFVFQNGCLLLVREQSNKKNQLNKNISDRFIRFLPIKGLQVELINNDNKQLTHTWQLMQTDPRTQLKTYFRFANKDALTFVKTINNCISAIKWQYNDYIHISELSSSVKPLSSSRSCYDLLSNRFLEKNESTRRSPSPIWKRRTASLRRRPLSMTNTKNFN